MDIRLVKLLEAVRDGSLASGDVARFLARYSWQLLESSRWEDMAVTAELEYMVAEIQAGLETEGGLRLLANEALDSFARPAALIQRQVHVIVGSTVDTATTLTNARLVLV